MDAWDGLADGEGRQHGCRDCPHYEKYRTFAKNFKYIDEFSRKDLTIYRACGILEVWIFVRVALGVINGSDRCESIKKPKVCRAGLQ
jgi:hypothetical protein